MATRLCSTGPRASDPLADRPFADTQGLGDRARGPALLLTPPGLQPSGCFALVR